MRALGLLLLFVPAWAQGVELGVYGVGASPTFFLRLLGTLPLEGGSLAYALAPYWQARWGQGGVSLERLVLRAEEGELGLALGRLPFSLGEGRVFPYTWNTPGPAGGEEGVWGGTLTWYGPFRLRLGYGWERGGVLELALPEVRAWLESQGGGLAGSLALGEAVAYGEARLKAGKGYGLVGVSWVLGEGLFTLEGTYPWGLGLAASWPLEELALLGSLGYREGWWGSLALEGEGWRVHGGYGAGAWVWGVSLKGEF
ncbi:hypothetical protein GCM10007092_18030 [Thermus composti]|uniref:Cellulose biosynthesis protein BcsS n=1 Tax=Thermus composti TaxID=532059 RepID=A0ABV6PZB6_9DEIN|nr:hypothetical protein [Thermus composti]GGN03909.1 hypothetical protein GCM10007092_18030 [Thermus composti]